MTGQALQGVCNPAATAVTVRQVSDVVLPAGLVTPGTQLPVTLSGNGAEMSMQGRCAVGPLPGVRHLRFSSCLALDSDLGASGSGWP
jgi:hypothetical protein